MQKIRNYFYKQIAEIQGDTALRFFGACIALGELLSYLNWSSRGQDFYLIKTPESVCWPFFENCFECHFADPRAAFILLYIYAACSVAAIGLFLAKRVKAGYWLLLGTDLLRIFIVALDFRLRANQHYMLTVVVLVFLLMPHKRDLLRYAVVLFYFWAGVLKLNPEWLSGKDLYHDPLFIHGAMLVPGCIYVVILEIVFIWGILSKNKWAYWLVFAQLICFHVSSWPVVGFFYPLLMITLLSIFPLTYFIKSKNGPESLIGSLASLKQPLGTYIFIGLFSLLQVFPRVIMPGNTVLTGEGRLFALHMFDSKNKCKGQITLRFKDRPAEKYLIPHTGVVRAQCDPVFYFSRAKYYCYAHKNDPTFVDLDINYDSCLSSQTLMRPLVDIKDFCSKDIHYHLFWHNDWIKVLK